MRSMTGRALGYGALALSLSGCATARGALGGATQSAANAAGEAAGRAIVAHFVGPVVPGAPAGLAGPQMMTYYANWMFTLAFNSGGYWLPNSDLQLGQSVTFEFVSNGEKQRMERAYLTKLPNGDQWWRVKWYSLTDKPDTVIFEAMFNPDRSQLLRMRGKTSGQQAGEIPVEQNTGITWREPTYLTTESLNAATVGTESVTTPAGTFSAKHIRYTLMGGGTYEWWAADNAPGGVVKYVVSYGSDSYTETLFAIGSNATTELGSY
jgi:hypothetical protein